MAVSAALGAVMLVAAYATAPPRPPQPTAGPPPASPWPLDSGSPAPATQGTGTSDEPEGRTAPPAAPLRRSEPTRITISRIGVDAEVIPLGVNDDGTLAVPSLETPQLTSWYRLGPTPGEAGSAVIVGHVDTYQGPAVFYRLGALRPGDTIGVTRRDNLIALFTVDRVESYPKTEFPTDLVYAPTRTPSLRLVTCGGEFDRDAGSYLSSTIVFATLTSSRGL
jgi:Sortase domain